MFVCVPSSGSPTVGFTHDLAMLMVHATMGGSPPGLIIKRRCGVDRNRNGIAELALVQGATHLLWLDDDTRFPWDTLSRLANHDLPFVAANCADRNCRQTARVSLGMDGEEAAGLSIGFPRGIVEVEAVGVAIALISVEVFRKVGFPWFESYYLPDGRWRGEDIDFCIKARKAGFTIHVDRELSEEVGHTGEHIFTMNDVRQRTATEIPVG